jgi:hypothetical protein
MIDPATPGTRNDRPCDARDVGKPNLRPSKSFDCARTAGVGSIVHELQETLRSPCVTVVVANEGIYAQT